MTDVAMRLGDALGAHLDPAIYSDQAAPEDAESVAAFVRKLVHNGTLKLDDEVPAEVLADACLLHRNTISKALGLLIAEGYLRRLRGRPARVASDRVVLPDRKAEMISQSEVARHHGLDISNEVTACARRRISELFSGRQPRVARRLELTPEDDVLVLSRIRVVKGEATKWRPVPAVAETAYFPLHRLPSAFYNDIEQGRVESISEHFRNNGIAVVSSEYRLRISSLPQPFHEKWAELASLTAEEVEPLRFLRLEATAHSHVGAVEFSIAYQTEGLYVFAASDVSVTIEPDAWEDDPTIGIAERKDTQH